MTSSVKSQTENETDSHSSVDVSSEASLSQSEQQVIDLSAWDVPSPAADRPVVEFFGSVSTETDTESVEDESLREIPQQDGPVLVHGAILVENDDGEVENPEIEEWESTPVYDGRIVNRHFLQTMMIAPVCERYPWLARTCQAVVWLFIVITLVFVILTRIEKHSPTQETKEDFSSRDSLQVPSLLPTLTPSPHFPAPLNTTHSSRVELVKVAFSFSSDTNYCCSVALSNDGNMLFVRDSSNNIFSYNSVDNGGQGWLYVESIPLLFKAYVPPFMSVSSDGSILAALGTHDGRYGVAMLLRNRGENGWQRFGETIVGENFFYSVALTDDGKTVVLGIPDENRVNVYVMRDETWSLRARLAPSADTNNADISFGYAVAMPPDGSRLVVSAPDGKDGPGGIHVYDLMDDAILQIVHGTSKDALLGYSVGIASDGRRFVTSVELDDVFGMIAYQLDAATNLYVRIGYAINLTSRSSDVDAQRSVAISADGSRAAAMLPQDNIKGEHTVKLFLFSVNENELKVIGEKTEPNEIYLGSNIDLSRTGKFVAVGVVGLLDGNAKVYELVESNQ